MFFRNLTLFRLHADTAADCARLAEVLPEHALREPGPLELFTAGTVPPLGAREGAAFTHTAGSATLFATGRNDRLLPSAVLNEALRRKVQEISESEARPVGGRERKRLKEDLFTTLLPRAFVVASRILGYVDTAGGWLVLDTGSRKAAEAMITQLREALGTFPAVPMAPTESPRVMLTHWLSQGLPSGFALGDECELRDPATASGAIAKCSRQDLDSEEVAEHLRNGKQVFKLGLVFDDRISFVLGEDLVIRKLKFLDVVLDQLDDNLREASDEIDARLALQSLELGRLLGKLDALFGLSPDAPLHLHQQPAPDGMREAPSAALVNAVKTMQRKAKRGGYSVTIETITQ